jgi:hypothetical protein
LLYLPALEEALQNGTRSSRSGPEKSIMSEEDAPIIPERRCRRDRRHQNVPVENERRKRPERRRRVDPVTCERNYTSEELEFLKAMEQFRRITQFPTCRQVLQIAYQLGYRKVAAPTPLPGIRPEQHNESEPQISGGKPTTR